MTMGTTPDRNCSSDSLSRVSRHASVLPLSSHANDQGICGLHALAEVFASNPRTAGFLRDHFDFAGYSFAPINRSSVRRTSAPTVEHARRLSGGPPSTEERLSASSKQLRYRFLMKFFGLLKTIQTVVGWRVFSGGNFLARLDISDVTIKGVEAGALLEWAQEVSNPLIRVLRDLENKGSIRLMHLLQHADSAPELQFGHIRNRFSNEYLKRKGIAVEISAQLNPGGTLAGQAYGDFAQFLFESRDRNGNTVCKMPVRSVAYEQNVQTQFPKCGDDCNPAPGIVMLPPAMLKTLGFPNARNHHGVVGECWYTKIVEDRGDINNESVAGKRRLMFLHVVNNGSIAGEMDNSMEIEVPQIQSEDPQDPKRFILQYNFF